MGAGKLFPGGVYSPGLGSAAVISPEGRTAQKTLENILELEKIRGLNIIITLKSIENLEEVKKILQKKDEKFLLNFKEPLFLSKFVENDIFQFYKENFKEFLKNVKYFEFLDKFKDDYFPLNEKILRNIYNSTNGNPREIVKYLIKIFNEIIYSDDKLENIDLKKPKPKKEIKLSLKKIKTKKKVDKKESKSDDEESKLSKLKSRFNKIGNLRRVIPSRGKKEKESKESEE